jgi:hypothetical protein
MFTVFQVQSFVHALRAKNASWLGNLSARLRSACSSPLLEQAVAVSTFGDIAAQLHWGDVRLCSLPSFSSICHCDEQQFAQQQCS